MTTDQRLAELLININVALDKIHDEFLRAMDRLARQTGHRTRIDKMALK